jgi:hypothetical protein
MMQPGVLLSVDLAIAFGVTSDTTVMQCQCQQRSVFLLSSEVTNP